MHELWLIYQCQRGDSEAFAALYERHRRRVFRTALHLVREPALAEDITQEAFISVFQEIARLRSPAAFRTWLYRVVVSRATRLLRAEGGVRRPLSLDRMLEASELQAPVSDEDEQAALRTAIAGLPADLRVPVLLHYFTGLRVAEVAAVLAIPPGTVKSRLHTARACLADALAPEAPRSKTVIKEMSI